MAPSLGVNQYGKAEVRMVAVRRDGDVHDFDDLTVSISLSGALRDVHLAGDNAGVLTTDTQANTVFAFAREAPVGAIEDFALRLARHFLDAAETNAETITRARVRITAAPWRRIETGAGPHPHSFTAAGAERRIAEVVADATEGEHVVSGLSDLVVLKTTGSEFSGFAVDRYTTLAETDDRILATSVAARWRHGAMPPEAGWDASFAAVRAAMLARFADLHSLSLQQTLYEMGLAALAASPGLVEVRLSMPNRHHFTVDLAPFGLDNPNVVFRVQDRPYGLIEGQVLADDAPAPGPAWDAHPLL